MAWAGQRLHVLPCPAAGTSETSACTHTLAPHTLAALFLLPQAGQDLPAIVEMSQKTGLN